MSKLLSALALSLAASAALAQSPCFNGSYGTALGTGDDMVLPMTSIGFAFPFAGQTYTDFYASTNGFIYLTNGGTPAAGGAGCCSGSEVTMVAGGPMIAVFWTDLNVVSGTGMVYANSSATGCTITWKNTYEYSYTSPMDFQIQLEPSGAIKFSYNASVATASHTVLAGMSPGGNATIPAASDWSVGGATTSDTGFELYVGGTTPFDMANTSLFFAPTNPGYVFVSVPIPATGCASMNTYGTACGGSFGSFYERFPTTPSIDLSNTAFRLLFTGTNYILLPSSSAFVAPSVTATNLGLSDDSEVSVTLGSALSYPGGSTTTLNVVSNGQVSTASNGSQYDYTPTAAEFLNWTNATWAVWRDMIPTSAGADNVYFEQVGSVAYITWLNVIGYVGTSAGTTPSTFQLQFDLSNGNVDFVFQSMDTVSISGWTGGDGYLVGWTPAGASVDAGSLDLTVAVPLTLTLSTTDVLPLALAGGTLPSLGANVPLNTSNIPTSAPFGAVGLGFVNPAFDLSFLGMTGCTQYTDNLAVLLFLPFGSPTASVNFSVPTDPSYIGLSVLAQSFAYAPAAGLNPLGASASNGLSINIGQ